MGFVPFYEKFPEIAEEETCIFSVSSHPIMPGGNYMLAEYFCDEKNCDCRKVMFMVFSEKSKTRKAVINYGWESKKFYKKWFGRDCEEALIGMYGLSLNLASRQSDIAHALMDVIKNLILKDPQYVKQLKRHYKMFREQVEKNKNTAMSFEKDKNTAMPLNRKKIGRNESCPCGSGKKYKRCCLNNKIVPLKRSGLNVKGNNIPNTYSFTVLGIGGRKITRREINNAYRIIKKVEKRIKMEEEEIFDDQTNSILDTQVEFSTPVLELYLQYANNGKADGSNSEFVACCFLLEESLVRLRYKIERDRLQAREQSEHIQKEIATHVVSLHFAKLFHPVFCSISALHQSGLEIISEIKEAVGQSMTNLEKFLGEKVNPLNSPRENKTNSVWEIYENSICFFKMLPTKKLIDFVFNLIGSGSRENLELAILLGLHPLQEVRKSVYKSFLSFGDLGRVPPSGLLRLITMRNWLPEAERPLLDQVIKQVKRARVECASYEPIKITHLYASCFDGSGGHAIWGAVLKNNKHYQIGLLIQQGLGIKDAWIHDDRSKKEIDQLFFNLKQKKHCFPIGEPYLDQLLSYFMAVTFNKKNIPSPSLLQLSELFGGNRWVASTDVLDFTLNEIIQKEKLVFGSALVKKVVRGSGKWIEKKFAEHWFEDHASVDRCLKDGLNSSMSLKALSTKVVKDIISPKKEIWIERLKWMALWRYSLLTNVSTKEIPDWKSFYLLAQQTEKSSSLQHIPLFPEIANRSLRAAMRRDVYEE